MKNGNKGQISVYVCGMVCVFLILIVVVLQGVRIWESKAKATQAVSGMVDSIKGDYQPDLFRRYHLFALDKTYYGKGEGYLEVRAKEYLNYNLNSKHSLYSYTVADVMLVDSQPLLEDDLTGFKQQIEEYMELKTPVGALEAVVPVNEIQQVTEEERAFQSQWEEIEQEIAALDNPALEGSVDLESIKELIGLEMLMNPSQGEILYLVMPEQAYEISKEEINTGELPSQEQKTSYPVLDGMTISELEEELYGIAYAMEVFQHAGTEEKTEENHCLEYEVEYLVMGKDSDFENMSVVAERLCIMRFVPNAMHAFTDQTKQQEAQAVATVLLGPYGAAFGKPVSYVLLAVWAYGESILDVKVLLDGGRVPLLKDKDSWQLSLEGLADIAIQEGTGTSEEEGWDYEMYLTCMLATMPDANTKYYRMLDLMQLNIQETIPEFRIENCIYAFRMQAEIQEGNRVWNMEAAGTYETN